MRIGIFDLETSGFYADNSILLCCSSKPYLVEETTTTRADQFPSWKECKTDERDVIAAVVEQLRPYDILIAHNGEWFDKGYLNAKCMQFGIEPILRWKKSIDPCQLSRRHMRVGRNSLAALIDFLEVPVKKTPIELRKWLKAAMNSDIECMDLIVEHCEYDIKTLEAVYDRLRGLVDKIDSRGSAY